MTRRYPTLAEERRQDEAECVRPMLAFMAIQRAREDRYREARDHFRRTTARERQKTFWLLMVFILLGFGYLALAPPAKAQTGYGYQIHERIAGEWQPFKFPLGRYASLQSETACQLELASAVSLLPSGTILACRRVPHPVPSLQTGKLK